MKYDLVEQLKKEIKGFHEDSSLKDVGYVVESSDGIARVSGLSRALSQELLNIETSQGDVVAVASNLEENTIGTIVLGDFTLIKAGDRVRKTNKVLSIKVGPELIGRVIDPLGNPLDGKGVIFNNPEKAKDYFLERPAPSVIARESVRTPLHSGVVAIDSMIPIGRGQRELIIGDRQTGKTAIALDAILNQKQDSGRKQSVCIYVAIGQKQSKIAQLVKILEESGALKYSIVVVASASQPASLQYLAPFAGCAVGEYFMDQGQDALVVYDDLSKHAIAYRQLSLLLRRPPGREAYPGDVFYLHARLLERAAKLNKELGGGSLTALPIIETQLGDVSAYIPTNVISITDGQIYLESSLFYKGFRPAVNVGLSVSRVGSSAQTKAMKKVAGKLRLELAQFRELQAFAQFSSDLDENTKARIARGERLSEILKQPDREPIPFERQVISLYAALNGFFDSVPVSDVRAREKELLDFIDKLYHDAILKQLQTTNELDENTESALKKAIDEFINTKALK